ncbi:YibE/F family protein [Proteiniborus sp. MB09-C3]|uniref:YibE/F family protein n=1 Tax=Proteiniborus sp. MB09-C3 TaxID=3050072 RepID=UPI0025561BBE|nr:YibE/F family protein [Proteiniborus sp. MB09-C3]WIV12090.1 YibE/F family protein [Proteiniborus sp. MB09-C3]
MRTKILKYFPIIVVGIIIILIFTSPLTSKKEHHFDFEKAEVISINEENLEEDAVIPDLMLGYQQIKIKILTGKYIGEEFNIKNPMSRTYNVHTKIGSKIIVSIEEQGEQVKSISVFNYKKEYVSYILVALFFLVLLIFGGMKGLKSFISLVFTGVLIIFFMIPLFFKGYSPILLTIITVAITTIVTIVMVDGLNKKTISAIAGTILGVIIAGIISYIGSNMAHLSGLTTNEAEELMYVAGIKDLKVRGLMFSAILIAALGAIMDVAMSIASSTFEIHKTNPNISFKNLMASGLNIGKDVMGTMSNTLILAFIGSSLNIIILLMAYEMPYTQLMNLDLIVTEVVQSISGSIGIILTVPITALISTYLALKANIKRSSKIGV